MSRRERMILLALAAALVPVGLAVKFRVPGRIGQWCHLYGAGLLYEVFWIVVLRLLAPRLPAPRAGGTVFGLTCILEVLQLWHPAWLDRIRATFPGAALLGTGFDPWDFPHYAIGSLAGVYLLTRVRRAGRARPPDGTGPPPPSPRAQRPGG